MISNKCLFYLSLFLIFICIILFNHYLNKDYLDKEDYLNNKYKNIENFEGNIISSSINDNFIIKRNDFLPKWEKLIKSYFKEFNEVNIIARGANNKNKLIEKYMLSLTNISNENINKSMNIIKNFYNENKDKLSIKYFSNNIKFKIIKITDDFDCGYPQTHSNYILMPNSWFNNPIPSTFIHEYCHIIQRNNQQLHNDFYKQWGFIKQDLSQIKGLEDIISRNRVNPDGLDINWIWKDPLNEMNKYYWIGAIFNSNKPNNLADVSYKWYEIDYGLNQHGQHIIRYNGNNGDLSSFNNFNKYFGISNNNYNPNEIFAELIVKWFFDYNNETNALMKLDKFLKE